MSESILVCRKKDVFKILDIVEGETVFKEFFDGVDDLDVFLEGLPYTYVDREEVEQDETLLQVIPYGIIFNEEGQVFAGERADDIKEGRLKGLSSIGWGGHANYMCDVLIDNVFENLQRELDEEIKGITKQRIRPLGIIYDGSNDIGRVHLGIVIRVTCNDDLSIAESTSKCGRFMEIAELVANKASYEKWSQIVIGRIGGN